MKASVVREEFKTNKYDEMLKDLYEDASLVDYQKDRYANALDKFIELYGDENASIYSAAGRSEICLLYTSPSPRDLSTSRMPSSA